METDLIIVVLLAVGATTEHRAMIGHKIMPTPCGKERGLPV
jgi:hypothetical protein